MIDSRHTIFLLFLLSHAPWFGRAAVAQEQTVFFSIGEDARVDSAPYEDHGVIGYGPRTGLSAVLRALSERLPRSADINALSCVAPDEAYFSLDADTRISGDRFADEDIVHWNGVEFSLWWDGSAHGLPRSADMNALHVFRGADAQDFVFSLDAAARVGVGGERTVADDGDVIRYRPLEGLSILSLGPLDASLPRGADVDAIAIRELGFMVLSLDRSFDTAGQTFDDSDLLVLLPSFDFPLRPLPSLFAPDEAGLGSSANVDAVTLPISPNHAAPGWRSYD